MSRRPPRLPARVGLVLCTVALLLVAGAWVGWRAGGGSLFVVGSPSMGRVAPVGSLVLVRPLAPGVPLRVGQIVVYHPSGPTSTPYIHRIVQVIPGGRFRTKGALNAQPDPWIGERTLVAGTPAAVIPALGWLYRYCAWLALGAATLLLAHQALPRSWREWVVGLGPAALLLVPIIRARPLVGGFVYGYGQHGRDAGARLVDTGILPVRFSAPGGRPVRAVPGQEVLVRGLAPAAHHPFPLAVSPDLPWWGWVAVAAVCLGPLVIDRLRTRRAAPATVPAPGDMLAAS